MAIWLGTDSRIIVQGMTGSEGRKHTQRMLDSGSVVVGGVTPGKGGQTASFNGADLPVFGSVAEAVEATAANTSVVFVPPKFTGSAVGEVIDADLDLVVCITEGVPVADSARFVNQSLDAGVRLIGPTVPASSRPASRTPASFRRPSPAPVRSAWSASRAP